MTTEVSSASDAELPEPPEVWPQEWSVKTSDTQDRWTVSIPLNTLTSKQLLEFDQRGLPVPGEGWQPQLPGRYAELTATLRSGKHEKKHKKATLSVELVRGGGEEELTISPLVFGRSVSDVTLEPGALSAFRRTRIRTKNMILRLVSITMGVVSAAIAASFAIGENVADPYVVSSCTSLGWKVFAAILAAGAPFVLLIGERYYLDTDIPDG